MVVAEENVLRIQQLIPEDWVEFPAIEPAIPAHYVLGEYSATGHALWGTKEDIARFNFDPARITSELITLRFSSEVLQRGATFSCESELENMFKQFNVKDFKVKKYTWGMYPVLTVESLRSDGTKVNFGWIGLNSETGTTILINLLLPKDGEQSCSVWKDFLNKTKQLEAPDFFRALGMDMRDGYSTYRCGSASVKVTAERKISNNLLAIKIEPLSSKTTYNVDSIDQAVMTTDWRRGAQIAKISGTMRQEDGKYGSFVEGTVITVLIKDVEAFSFDLDTNKHPKETVIIKKLLSQDKLEVAAPES